MKFSKVDKYGRVLAIYDAPSMGVAPYLSEDGERLVESTPLDTSSYYDNGWVSIGNPPGLHHIFDYETKQWIDPRTPATQWPIVRQERDRLLAATDWTQLPDVPLATKEAWAVYRQALRDVTLQPDPFNITWPEVPSK